MFKDISLKAVTLGFLADLGLSVWWRFQFTFPMLVKNALDSIAAGHLDRFAFHQTAHAKPAHLIVYLYIGASALIGGALTARLATKAPTKNVYAQCALKACISAGLLAHSKFTYPVWPLSVSLALSLGLPVVGGWLSPSLFGPGPQREDPASGL